MNAEVRKELLRAADALTARFASHTNLLTGDIAAMSAAATLLQLAAADGLNPRSRDARGRYAPEVTS